MQTKAERVIKLSAVMLLCCLGIIIYSNTFCSSFHFDDEPSIVKNLNIKNLAQLRLIWDFAPTRFITCLSFAFNYHLHQLRVLGYHLFNLAIHLCTTILVWWFILLTFATPEMKNDKITQHANLIAFLSAAVFVSHPLQTEAITYIVQRATSLAALFYLFSLCLYIKSRVLRIEKNDSNQNHNLYYAASLIIASVGMFTKEIIITLPLAIVVYELSFLKTQVGLNWRKILPFFIISLIIPLTLLFTKSENAGKMVEAIKYAPNIPRWSYLLTQFRVTITYLRLLFIPLNQNLDYDYRISKTLFELPVLASIALLAIIIIAAIRISSRYRLLSFGIFWFFLTLLPESSIIPLQDVIFEHRLYLPMLGYSIFLVSIMYYLFRNRSIKVMVLILLLTIHWYAILAYNRNLDWKDEFTLWNDTVQKSPKKARPYGNRGIANFNLGNLDQAISEFNIVIYTNPNYYEAYVDRGNVYVIKGNFIQAFSDFDKALQINPKYTKAYYNRAVAYFWQKEYNKAWQDIHKAEELGKMVNLEFLNALKKASEREK
jgi:tetratricopeptide (TPR) repeat protein